MRPAIAKALENSRFNLVESSAVPSNEATTASLTPEKINTFA